MPGCRAAESPQLHWPTSSAPPLEPTNPRLWIALAARLGAQPSPQPLVLRSAAGWLTLRDGRGQSWRAERFILRWQRQPLSSPVLMRRQVAGPYASFESAERVAQQWRRLGVLAVVAHPADWEVWAPAAVPVPAGLVVREWQQRQSQAVVPVLALPGRPPQALQGPLQLDASVGLRWKGGVYAGPFRLQADAHGSWTLVEQVPLERYLEGVVPHEIGAAAPPEALAAQAVLARTWALSNVHRYEVDGYHLCATVQCQVYSDPRQAGAAVRQAIARTRHQVLSWQGAPIHAVYHASNGGVAASLQEAWDALPQPYLQAGLDQSAAGPRPVQPPVSSAVAALLRRQSGWVGADHPLFRWSRLFDREQLGAALAQRGRQLGRIQRLTVLERGPSGRVLALAVEGTAGREVLRLDAIRRTLRRLPSTLFDLQPVGPGLWRFEGGGFGHGVGLSQAGAIDLGRRGWTYQNILKRYYPGTRLLTLEELGGVSPSGKP